MLDKNKFNSAVAGVGLTHYELAKLVGMSKNTLSNKLNGHSCFNTKEIDDICNVLGIESSTEKANIFLAKSSHNRDDENIKAG